jgi:hypothetical protein
VKFPKQSIHVVRASMQDRAKNILAANALVQMSEREIVPYLKSGEKLSHGSFSYLVRAAAYYVNEKYEFPMSAFNALPFDASYSPSRDTLIVTNFALGYAGMTPSNLALAIEVPSVIGRSEAVCLRTQ